MPAVAVLHVSPFICSAGRCQRKEAWERVREKSILLSVGDWLTEWDERRKEVMRLFKGKLNLGN